MTNSQPKPDVALPQVGLPETPALPGATAGPLRVSLEEVLEAGTQNLKLSLDIAGVDGLDFESLNDAVEKTQSRLVAKGADTAADEDALVTQERDGGAGLVRNEIHCLVALLEAGTQTPNLEDEAQSALERASIILHESHQAIGFDTLKYGKAVDQILRSNDSVDVERFARSAIADMSTSLAHGLFDAWMPAILLTARRATPSLCDWLAEIAATADSHAREALWPYIVDELLVTLKERQEPAPAVIYSVTGLSLDLAIERLIRLPSIHRSLLAPGMFSLRQSYVHALLIRLMDGPARHVVGPVIMAAFKEVLPTDPGVSYCVFATRQYNDSIGWLLTEQLKDLKAQVPDEAQRSAAWVLMSALDQLHPERRGEVWVPGALEWLGSRDMAQDPDAQVQSTHALLQRIVSERQGLRKVWSRDCRRIASQALAGGGLS